MNQDIRKNFEEKASYVASIVTGMTVTDQSSFLTVDCGLPSDTFNVIVVRDLSEPQQLLASIDHFTTKGFPMAVWCWENDVDSAELSHLTRHSLIHAEIETSMSLDLSETQPAEPVYSKGLEIRQVATVADLQTFGNVVTGGFGASDEAHYVRAYFEGLCQLPLNLFPKMQYFLALLDGVAVASGTLFVGSETLGIYDIVTDSRYRRRGIGSAMFQRILNEAQRYNRRCCVLQSSADGRGIYERAGFKAVGAVHILENRGLL